MSDAGLPAGPAWFRFVHGDAEHLGVVDASGGEPRWLDLGPADVVALLHHGALTGADLRQRMAAGTTMDEPGHLLPPVPRRGGKILCLAKNYVKHAREFGAEAPPEPIFFAKLPDTLVGHREGVVVPAWLEGRVDHEAELALVLGFEDLRQLGSKPTDADGARAVVRGYTIANDVTARSLQGNASNEKAKEMGALVKPMADYAWSIAEGA